MPFNAKHTVRIVGVVLLALVACRKQPGVALEEQREVLFPQMTKAGEVLTSIPEFDPADASKPLVTFRAFLLEQDIPSHKPAAQGTYCNIYKTLGGSNWYHPLHCNENGAALTDKLDASISSWSKAGSVYTANGSIPEYTYATQNAADTWGDSKYSLWAQSVGSDETETELPYRFLIVSPAKGMTDYVPSGLAQDNEANHRYGIYQRRKEELWMSPLSSVLLSDSYLSPAADGSFKYVFDQAEDLVLKQQRSKLSVNVYVDEVLDHVTIDKIVITNYLKGGLFFPMDFETTKPSWHYNYDSENRLFTAETYEDEDGSRAAYDLTTPITLQYKNAEGNVNPPVPVFHDFYLLSQDYSEQDGSGQPLHPVPIVRVILLSGLGEAVRVSVPLALNFKPQYHYRMSLRIATWNLYLYVVGTPWDLPATDTGLGGDWDASHQQEISFGEANVITIPLQDALTGDNTHNWDDGGVHNGAV